MSIFSQIICIAFCWHLLAMLDLYLHMHGIFLHKTFNITSFLSSYYYLFLSLSLPLALSGLSLWALYGIVKWCFPSFRLMCLLGRLRLSKRPANKSNMWHHIPARSTSNSSIMFFINLHHTSSPSDCQLDCTTWRDENCHQQQLCSPPEQRPKWFSDGH